MKLLSHVDMGLQKVKDAEGNEYDAYVTKFIFDEGEFHNSLDKKLSGDWPDESRYKNDLLFAKKIGFNLHEYVKKL